MLTRRCRCCAPPPRAEAPLIAGSPRPGDGPGGSHGSFPMLAAVLRDPTLTGVDRLPMRTTAAPFPDLDASALRFTRVVAVVEIVGWRLGRPLLRPLVGGSRLDRRGAGRCMGVDPRPRRMDDPTGQRRQPVRAAPLHQRDHGLRRRPARRTRGESCRSAPQARRGARELGGAPSGVAGRRCGVGGRRVHRRRMCRSRHRQPPAQRVRHHLARAGGAIRIGGAARGPLVRSDLAGGPGPVVARRHPTRRLAVLDRAHAPGRHEGAARPGGPRWPPGRGGSSRIR